MDNVKSAVSGVDGIYRVSIDYLFRDVKKKIENFLSFAGNQFKHD